MIVVSAINPEPAYAQNLESFASKVRGLLSSTLLRTLAVIAVIVTGLLWFTGRASTTILVTVIIGIAIVFRSEEHTSELQSLMRNSYAVFCLKKKTTDINQ